MALEYDEHIEWIDWDFRPYYPVRPYNHKTGHFIRENIYVHHWQRLMTHGAIEPVLERSIMREDRWFVDNESKCYPVLKIFNGYTPTSHDTRIASNFILYLGYNNGISFLDKADKLSKKFMDVTNGKSRAYLAQWAFESSSSDLFAHQGVSPRYDFAQTDQRDAFYEPKYRDLRTLERMALWCGTGEGQKFIASCERTIKNMQQRHYPVETELRTTRRNRLASILKL